MIKLKKIAFFIFLFSTIISCKKENLGDCFKSTGEIVLEQRQIPSFESLELHDRINLFVSFGTEISLTIEAGENLLEHIETEVKNNILIIKNNNRCNWVRSFKKEMNVYLTAPSIKGINHFGSGELRFRDTLTRERFTFNMYEASGDGYLLLNTQQAELKTHTGTGTITAKGKVDYLVAFVGGNGFVDASAVEGKRGLAVAVNTGYIRINVSEELEATISGTGNIEYYGNPVIDLSDTGGGKLIKRD
ncbi:MAG: head GIN domain-containing protein [Vicingaceae bacterium]